MTSSSTMSLCSRGAPIRTDPLQPNRQPRFPLVEELKIRCWTGLALGALWLLGKTTRKRYIGAEELFARWQRRDQVILAFWHNRLLLMLFPYRGQKACIMNSAHRDGEIITRVSKRFGISAVRGSSTRGWLGGLKCMMAAYRRGAEPTWLPWRAPAAPGSSPARPREKGPRTLPP